MVSATLYSGRGSYEKAPLHLTQANHSEGCMTSDEREKMESLCRQITNESNPGRFDELVAALNDLLEAKQEQTPTVPQ